MNYAAKLEEAINRLIEATVDYKITIKHHHAYTGTGLSDIGKIIENIADEALNDNIVPNVFQPKIVAKAETPVVAPIKAQRQPQRQQTAKATSDNFKGASDKPIIEALMNKWGDAGDIHNIIGGYDAPCTRSNVHGRLITLAKTHPHLVEQHPKNFLWRKARADGQQDAAVSKPKRRTVRKAASRHTVKKPNPFAALSKLAASVLTNRFKTRDQIANDVRGHGWKGSLALLGPVLNGLVNSGAAEEIDGRYRRA